MWKRTKTEYWYVRDSPCRLPLRFPTAGSQSGLLITANGSLDSRRATVMRLEFAALRAGNLRGTPRTSLTYALTRSQRWSSVLDRHLYPPFEDNLMGNCLAHLVVYSPSRDTSDWVRAPSRQLGSVQTLDRLPGVEILGQIPPRARKLVGCNQKAIIHAQSASLPAPLTLCDPDVDLPHFPLSAMNASQSAQ